MQRKTSEVEDQVCNSTPRVRNRSVFRMRNPRPSSRSVNKQILRFGEVVNEKENYGRKIYKHIVSGVIDYSPISLLGRQGFLSGQASGDPLLTFNMTREREDIVSNTLSIFDGQEVMPESSTIRFKR